MATNGYPAHVSADFVTSLTTFMYELGLLLKIMSFALDTTAITMDPVFEHVLVPLQSILCDNTAFSCSKFRHRTDRITIHNSVAIM